MLVFDNRVPAQVERTNASRRLPDGCRIVSESTGSAQPEIAIAHRHRHFQVPGRGFGAVNRFPSFSGELNQRGAILHPSGTVRTRPHMNSCGKHFGDSTESVSVEVHNRRFARSLTDSRDVHVIGKPCYGSQDTPKSSCLGTKLGPAADLI